MEKSTMEPVKVHLNNDMETYYSITKKLFYYKKHGKDTEVQKKYDKLKELNPKP